MRERRVGLVTRFDHESRAITVRLVAPLARGEFIQVLAHDSGRLRFEQVVSVMRLAGREVERAQAGRTVTVSVSARGRAWPQDLVYALTGETPPPPPGPRPPEPPRPEPGPFGSGPTGPGPAEPEPPEPSEPWEPDFPEPDDPEPPEPEPPEPDPDGDPPDLPDPDDFPDDVAGWGGDGSGDDRKKKRGRKGGGLGG